MPQSWWAGKASGPRLHRRGLLVINIVDRFSLRSFDPSMMGPRITSQWTSGDMDTKLRGKTALVTGGSSGIGLAIAQMLADEGADVAVASHNPSQEIVEELKSRRGSRCAISVDLSEEKCVRRMIDEAIEKLGHLDLYVNNAARAIHQPLTRIDSEACHTIVNTNLLACLWGCQSAARHMISRGGGAILIVGSTSMYTPGPGEIVYRMTKTALKPLAVSLAIELAPHNIRVNLLVPGYFRTKLTAHISGESEEQLFEEIPLRRAGDTRECANAAAFLLSDALSGYTTGAELLVDGGVAMRPLTFSTHQELRDMNLLDVAQN